MGKYIQIVEVGPRDGFQNLREYIPAETKMEIIGRLADAGITHMQHTSFVSPKAVPQLKDAEAVTRLCLERYPEVRFFALIPNLYGARKAWELGLKEVSYVVSLSESHNKANINRTHAQSFEELERIRGELPDLEIWLDASTAFACPFEGVMELDALLEFLRRPYALGLRTCVLADTIGYANPKQVREFVAGCKQAYPDVQFQIHIHDTRNLGMANTLAAIESGVDTVQSTLGGLGGCPFAPGASGNTATEDLVFMLEQMGYETGVDLKKLVQAAQYERAVVVEGIYSGHQFRLALDKLYL